MAHARLPWKYALLPLLIVAFYWISEFAQPPAPGSLKPKIFVLGLSKTGTTSIGDALERLGYRRLGWRDVRSRHMVHAFANNQLAPLYEVTRYYDALEDLPWPSLYREMADLYPDAKFILSLRKDEQTWFRSMRVHVGRGKWEPHQYFYGADTIDGNEDVVIQSYRNHTANVRHFFADKQDRYLEMNIDDGDTNWRVLCRIAQCPNGRVPAVGFPKSNTATSWNMGLLFNNVNWYKGWIITKTEEQTSQYYYHSGRTLLKPLLSASWGVYDIIDRACTEVYFQTISALILPPVTGMVSMAA